MNAEQQEIFDIIRGGTHKKLFIDAPAGTGKSFLLNQLINAREDDNYLILVPTNKAAIAFGGISEDNKHLSTVAKFLDMKPFYDEDGEQHFSIGCCAPGDMTIYIDEATMVKPTEMSIIEANYENIICFGDSCQLKPVKCNSIFVQRYESRSMNEIMRTCHLQPMYNLFREIQLGNRNFMTNLLKNNLINFRDLDTHHTVLCYTNPYADKMNKDLCEKYYGDEGFHEGMRVYVKKGVIDRSLVNSAIYEISGVEKTNYYSDYFQATFPVYKFIANEKEQMVLADKSMDRFLKRFKEDLKYQVPFGQSEINKFWLKYNFELQRINKPVSYAGAMTIHKSQGSTIEHVVVAYQNFIYLRRRNPDLFNRLMYVAVSRASDSISFLN